MSDTLKPCPFCGAIINGLIIVADDVEPAPSSWAVYCKNCKCVMHVDPDEPKEKLIAKWNTRTADREPKAVSND